MLCLRTQSKSKQRKKPTGTIDPVQPYHNARAKKIGGSKLDSRPAPASDFGRRCLANEAIEVERFDPKPLFFGEPIRGKRFDFVYPQPDSIRQLRVMPHFPVLDLRVMAVFE